MRTHPDRVGKYRILRMLGEGGMGTVYLAEHEFLGVRRAVKVLLPELAVQPGARQRFIDEARILVRLAHPNIVQVHDMDADGDCLYIAMDFVSPDGEHTVALDHHLEAKGRRLPAGEAAALMAQVLRAVDFAHSRKVIHRDIKPANLLLDRGGVVRVSDFGLARIAGNAFFTHVQQSQSMMADSLGAMATFDPSLLAAVTPADENSTGAQETYHGNTAGDTAGAAAAARAVGTPHFMPPEVLNRTGEWSEKGDIYSLGVLACLMVTGNYPIGQYRSPHAFDAAIPLVWDELVERALQQAPADRFASAREMLDLLLEAYPLLGDDAGRAGATRHTTAGDVPESAVLMVRDFVTRQKARWDRDVWTDFVIDFYRTPGHTAVTKDQVGQLAEKEKLEWLEREARRRDEEVKRAEELAQRQREAEETRRRLELERKAQPHRDLAREAGQAGRWTEALDAWNAVLRLMPDDAETRRCRDEAGRIGAKPMEDEAVRLFQEHRYDEAAELLARVELLIPGNESVSRRRTEAKNRAALISRNISQAERLGPGHNREVLALCKAVLEIDPDNMRASELYLRALSCIKAADRDTIEAKRLCHLKKFSGALSLLQQVVINDPESEEIKTLVTAAKEALTSASDCVQKGKAALQSKMYSDARGFAKKAQQIAPFESDVIAFVLLTHSNLLRHIRWQLIRFFLPIIALFFIGGLPALNPLAGSGSEPFWGLAWCGLVWIVSAWFLKYAGKDCFEGKYTHIYIGLLVAFVLPSLSLLCYWLLGLLPKGNPLAAFSGFFFYGIPFYRFGMSLGDFVDKQGARCFAIRPQDT